MTTLLFAAEDVGTYCFPKDENANDVLESISFLQAQTDRFQVVNAENCLDIFTNANRLPLYEKLIYKKFHPLKSKAEVADGTVENCRIEFTKKDFTNLNSEVLAAGEKNKLNVTEQKKSSDTITNFLVSRGKSAELNFFEKVLSLECVKTDSGRYNLKFSYADKKNSALSTSITVNAGEVVDVGSIEQKINEKSNTVGIPTTSVENKTGNEKIKYELKVL